MTRLRQVSGFLALLFLVCSAEFASSVEIVLSCGATGTEFKDCQNASAEWSKKTGHSVKVVSAPSNVSERLGIYQMLLAARSKDIDVFPMDVTWPGIIGSHFIDLNPYVSNELKAEHFPAYIENNTVSGKLLAMPAFIDAGILYYRKDLLSRYNEPIPTTWAELERIAAKIQKAYNQQHPQAASLWGYVFQGRAFEGLTCNALEWIASYGGGTVVNDLGEVTVNNPQAREALERIAGWIGTLSPEGVLNYGEEEARSLFQSGRAIFMRNWPYAWKLSQSADSPVRGKVGVAQLPHGESGQSVAALGGLSFAVSRYSAHPEEAVNLVLFLTARRQQKRRALDSGFNPTLPALYSDPELLEAFPFMKDMFANFQNALPRPARATRTQYNRVSSEFWDATHLILSGQKSAPKALAELEEKLKRVSRGGRW